MPGTSGGWPGCGAEREARPAVGVERGPPPGATLKQFDDQAVGATAPPPDRPLSCCIRPYGLPVASVDRLECGDARGRGNDLGPFSDNLGDVSEGDGRRV